jgi:hypothetical protein
MFLHNPKGFSYDILEPLSSNNCHFFVWLGETETQVAFEKHFAEEIAIYGPVCVVNLVDQAGKEKIVWDAYTNHILAYNSLDLIYTTFDFHEYW